MNTHCAGSCENVRATAMKESSIELQSGHCVDRHDDCPAWAALGECDSVSNGDMRKYCAVSCGICEAEPGASSSGEADGCVDGHENCAFWAQLGECDANPNYMKINCQRSCKTCPVVANTKSTDDTTGQTETTTSSSSSTATLEESELKRQTASFGTIQAIEGTQKDEVVARVEKSIAYMQSEVVQTLPETVRTQCQNRNELCAFWAVIGECEKNAAYMKTNCAPSCMTCELIDINQRCPKLPADVEPALYPGDLNKMFERILRHAPGNRSTTDLSDDEKQALTASMTPLYTVHVHSRPEPNVTEVSAAMDKSTPPWVITMDNFITDEECEALIQLGHDHEYKRSEDVGELKFDGSHGGVQSERRTSENAWCSTLKGCRQEAVPTRVHQRMSDLMGIAPENSEDMQLLKYEIGQF
jgi:prolyl 4-hydroxylase